jgi:hypothetical protein
MPLDKDVFGVSFGRRDDFYSFPKRNHIESIARLSTAKRLAEGAVLVPELGHVASTRTRRAVDNGPRPP